MGGKVVKSEGLV